MRVRRLTSDDGTALIGRVLDTEQVRAVRTGFGLDGGPAMTGAETFAAVLERGNALSLGNGWRLARRRLMGGNRVEIEGPAETDLPVLRRMGCTVEIVSFRAGYSRPTRPRWKASSTAGRSPRDSRRIHPFNTRPGYVLPAGRRPEPPQSKELAMTAQTLPDNPNFCLCPAYDVETEVQQIRIVIEGLAGHVPTALISLDLDDALSICDKLNRRLGLDREAWTAMVAAAMYAEDGDPDSDPWH